MKRWLRVILLAVLAVGLCLTVRRELGIRRSVQDNDRAMRLAGIPEESPAPPAPVPPEEVSEEEPPDAPALPEEAAALLEVDLEALREVNPDVIGWIMLPGTELSYPLLYRGDNGYYLERTWTGAYSAAGSIFLEQENDPSLEGFHTIVYGHRMRDGSMFGLLREYKDQDFWREHPSVYIAVDGAVLRYDIFAAREAAVRGIVYRLDLKEAGLEEDFIRDCLEGSVIDTGLTPEAGDQFLTLSTCTGKGYDARWVVHTALVQRYETPEAG